MSLTAFVRWDPGSENLHRQEVEEVGPYSSPSPRPRPAPLGPQWPRVPPPMPAPAKGKVIPDLRPQLLLDTHGAGGQSQFALDSFSGGAAAQG